MGSRDGAMLMHLRTPFGTSQYSVIPGWMRNRGEPRRRGR